MRHRRVTGSLPGEWPVVRVLGIVGLLRKPAFVTLLMAALQPSTPPDVRFQLLDTALCGVLLLDLVDEKGA